MFLSVSLSNDILKALCAAGRRVSAERRVGRVVMAAALCFAGCPGIINAQVTIHVPKDQPTIQAGINAANSGDTVLVDPGTYKEGIDFKGKAITVESSAGPASTIIDGSGNAFVVTFQSNETRSSILRGFTIQNGGTGLPIGPSYTNLGGMQVINGSNPSILGNTITHNNCNGVYSQDSAPLIQNNEISSTGLIYLYQAGIPCVPPLTYVTNLGGVYLVWSTGGSAPSTPAVISGNTIENNPEGLDPDADDGIHECGLCVTGVFSVFGTGKAYPQGLYYVVENNIVRNNGHDGLGGINLLQTTGMSGVFSQNLIYGNTSICYAGGVSIWTTPVDTLDPATSVLFVNNMIGMNSAPVSPWQCGQATSIPPPTNPAYATDVNVAGPAQVEFANNIIYGNTSLPAFSVIPLDSFPFTSQNINDIILDHNDFYSTGGPSFNSWGTPPNPIGSYGNISVDPLFKSATSNDFHLQTGSPVIDAGNNSVLQQLDNLGWPLTTDLDGNPRIQDATGKGYPIVDMGPYEYPGVQDTDPTTMLLTPSNYNPSAGASVLVTAHLVSASGIPTGTVTFFANGVKFAGAVIDGNGAATATITPPSPGVITLFATYPGEAVFSACVSVQVLIVVQPASTTLKLSSSANPSLVHQSVTFAATLGGSLGAPPGSVQFTDSGAVLGSGTINSSGVAT